MEEAEEENKEDVYGGGGGRGGRGGRGRRHLPDGLVHASQVSNDITFQRDDTDEAKVQSLSYFFPVDAKVFAKVLKCEKDPARGWKVSLSMKNVDQESGEDKDPENRENGFNANNNTNNNHDGYRNNNNNASTASFTADLFGVYEGKVSSIKPYGVFVNLENTRTSALIHVSEISEHLRFSREDTDEDKVMGIEGVLSVGESCFVKIIEMKPPESERDRMKLSGSIRLVDQKSGEDLDPENRKLRERRDGGGGGDGGRFNKKPVGADAGEKVQPGGIVHWGHEKADVKEQSKNAYDFVVDVEDDQKHEPKADDYSKPRFGHGLEGYVPEIKKGKKRKDSSSSKKDKKKDSKKRKKREKKEKKKRKKSRKRDKRKKKSSSSSHSSSSSDSDSYSSSSY
jgi:predicted RNA-binding protein with RPS1 domain